MLSIDSAYGPQCVAMTMTLVEGTLLHCKCKSDADVIDRDMSMRFEQAGNPAMMIDFLDC